MAAMERIMKFMHLEGAQEGLHSVAHIMFRLVHASGCLVVSKIFLSGGWKLLETPTRYQRKFWNLNLKSSFHLDRTCHGLHGIAHFSDVQIRARLEWR